MLLIVAADRRELAALEGPNGDFAPYPAGLRWSALGRLHGRSAVLAAHGPGRANVRQAVLAAHRHFKIGAAVSTGWAGALDPRLRAGDLLMIDRVIELEHRVEYAVRLPDRSGAPEAAVATLLTVDEVIQGPEAKSCLRRLGASAVDMEASAVAAEARKLGCPFYCVRVVSDEAETRFPIDFNRVRRSDGTFSGWRILVRAGASPSRWRQLLALRRDAWKACERLGSFLRQCRFDG